MWKVSYTYISTPYFSSLFVFLRVSVLFTLKSFFKLLDVSILILGGSSSGWPQHKSFILKRPPALLKSVCFIFTQIFPEGDQISVGSRARQCIPSCPATDLSPLPSMTLNPPLYPSSFIRHRHMSWWVLSIIGVGSMLPCSGWFCFTRLIHSSQIFCYDQDLSSAWEPHIKV